MDVSKIFAGIKWDVTGGFWISPEIEEVSYRTGGHRLLRRLEDASFWFAHRNNCIRSVLSNYKCSWLLDVGGGNGFVSKFLQSQGLPVVLLEPGIEGVHAARESGIEHVIQGSFNDSLIKPGTLNGVGLFDVLEHIKDDNAMLARIYYSLEWGGRLYLTVPAHQFLWSRSDVNAGHFRRYSLRSLSELLCRHGFHIKYQTYVFSFLPPMIIFFRKLLRLDPLANASPLGVEHKPPGLIRKLIDRLLRMEAGAIRKGKTIRFGSSCLVVAEKEDPSGSRNAPEPKFQPAFQNASHAQQGGFHSS